MNILTLKLSREIENLRLQEKKDETTKTKTKGKKIDRLKELSPKTIRRNISNDNFMKFQWSWTL
tara:strand:+ start:998 stop:1189 length:192 start_codon:yes stop_codon:yes gene_type:complete